VGSLPRVFEDRKVLWLDYSNRLRPVPGLNFSGNPVDQWRLARLLEYAFILESTGFGVESC
jgi:hypothetical protein